jgi:hypothetical protein
MAIRQRKHDKRQGAFKSERIFRGANRAIDLLRDRAIGFKKSPITIEDLLHICVPPELQQVAMLCVKEFDVDPPDLIEIPWVEPTSKTKVMVNMYPQFKPDGLRFAVAKSKGHRTFFGTEEHEAKLNAWVKWRLDRGREWSLVQAVFDTLDQLMPSPAHVRFYWPSIAALCALSPYAAALADDLRDWKPPSNIPPIPPLLRKAVLEADSIVARALLLDSHVPDRDDEVNLTIDMTYEIGRVPWSDNRRFQAM